MSHRHVAAVVTGKKWSPTLHFLTRFLCCGCDDPFADCVVADLYQSAAFEPIDRVLHSRLGNVGFFDQRTDDDVRVCYAADNCSLYWVISGLQYGLHVIEPGDTSPRKISVFVPRIGLGVGRVGHER